MHADRQLNRLLGDCRDTMHVLSHTSLAYLTYVTYVHAISAVQVPIHIPTEAARPRPRRTPPGMRTRCVCAVFLPGGLSGNARAAMPMGGWPIPAGGESA